jgi:hypothetical protein
MRSTGITHFLRSTDVATTQRISGHRTPLVLLRNYVHISDRAKIAAVNQHAPALTGED